MNTIGSQFPERIRNNKLALILPNMNFHKVYQIKLWIYRLLHPLGASILNREDFLSGITMIEFDNKIIFYMLKEKERASIKCLFFSFYQHGLCFYIFL